MKVSIEELTNSIQNSTWKKKAIPPTQSWGDLIFAPISDLVVDIYQREIKAKKIKAIVENFRIDDFGALTVSKRGKSKKYYVVDGQHRAIAARILGLEAVPCLKIKRTGRQAEARVFKDQGQRSNPTGIDLFRAAVISGSRVECEITKWLTALDMEVSMGPGPSHVRFVSSFVKRWKIDSDACKRALLTLVELAGEDGLSGDIHGGLWYLERRDISTAHYTKKIISQGGFTTINGTVNAMKMNMRYTPSSSRNNPRIFGMAILDVINHGKRKNRIKLPAVS